MSDTCSPLQTDSALTQPQVTPEPIQEVQAPKNLITAETLEAANPPVGWWGKRFRGIEAFISRLSSKSNFWHRVCSLFFLRLAFRTGIKLGAQKDGYYETIVPFRKFNRNWYNAMGGAALLANSEIAGGMYIFQKLGSDYTVVCKELNYKFRLPCLGPAVYRVKAAEDLDVLRQENLEFNFTVEMDVIQAVVHKGEKERKVGTSTATFHVAPKALMRQRSLKLKQRTKERRMKAKAKHAAKL